MKGERGWPWAASFGQPKRVDASRIRRIQDGDIGTHLGQAQSLASRTDGIRRVAAALAILSCLVVSLLLSDRTTGREERRSTANE